MNFIIYKDFTFLARGDSLDQALSMIDVDEFFDAIR